MEADAAKERRSFHLGETLNKMPHENAMRSPNAIQDLILKGWMPETPFIGKNTNIVAFGSCFAANIGRYLNGLGFHISTQKEGKAYVQKINDGLVNVFAIAQQFEWAWENQIPKVELWHGWKAEDFGYDEEVRLETKRIFDEANVFILTFGLSEIWYDEPTGEVFWRAVPDDKYDPSRHKFRVATQEETLERITRIYSLIRKHRPDAAIIYTLSPVGLAATFRPVSAITANSVSKSRLRSAIDQLHTSANDPNFFYFPSYEVVLEAFDTPFNVDRRHPAIHVIETNMKAFERYFCETGMTDQALQDYIKDSLGIDHEYTHGDRQAAVERMKSVKAEFKTSAGASSAEIEVKRRKKQEIRAAKTEEREARLLKKASNLLRKKPDPAQAQQLRQEKVAAAKQAKQEAKLKAKRATPAAAPAPAVSAPPPAAPVKEAAGRVLLKKVMRAIR